MSDLIVYGTKINKEKFAMAKNKLKDIAILVDKSVEIDKVNTSDFFMFNHNVTGKELNKIITQIQNNLIASNKMQSKIIKELNEVYDTVEYLDKEYINSIIMSLKAAEKVDDDLKEEQKKISKMIEEQKKTIYGLVNLKNEIADFETDIGNLSENIASLSSSSNMIMKSISECQNKVDVLEQSIIKLENTKREDNKALIISIVAVIGVLIEGMLIVTKL